MEGTIYPRLVLLVYVLCFLCFSMCVELVPVVKCPEYVDEDSDLLGCECVAPLMEDGIQISWPEYSNTSQLTLKAVSRKANGTVFVCQMARMGVVTNTTYTLQVAFGPSDATMSITGPARFVTDGHRPLTLACEAHEVNPKPIITWQFGPCNHGVERDTCTFTPEISYHGRNITCRAINSVPKDIISATTNYTLRLEYPPIKPPEITGHKEGEIRKPGDSLKCTVSGGKPQVASVNFTCSNPPMADQPDEHLKNAISSALVLQAPTQSNFETVCTCSALWGPEPGLYPHVVKVSFAVQLQSHVSAISPVTTAPTDGSRDEGTSNSTNTWMVVAILLLAVIVIGGIALVVLWRTHRMCFSYRTAVHDKIRNPQDKGDLKRENPVLSDPDPGTDTPGRHTGCRTPVDESGNASGDTGPNEQQQDDGIPDQDDQNSDTVPADRHQETLPLLHKGPSPLPADLPGQHTIESRTEYRTPVAETGTASGDTDPDAQQADDNPDQNDRNTDHTESANPNLERKHLLPPHEPGIPLRRPTEATSETADESNGKPLSAILKVPGDFLLPHDHPVEPDADRTDQDQPDLSMHDTSETQDATMTPDEEMPTKGPSYQAGSKSCYDESTEEGHKESASKLSEDDGNTVAYNLSSRGPGTLRKMGIRQDTLDQHSAMH